MSEALPITGNPALIARLRPDLMERCAEQFAARFAMLEPLYLVLREPVNYPARAEMSRRELRETLAGALQCNYRDSDVWESDDDE